MRYIDNKALIFFLLVFLMGCESNTKTKDTNQYVKDDKVVISNGEVLQDRQYSVLLNIASQLIQEEQNKIQKSDGLNCSKPVAIWIKQKEEYKGISVYSIYWSNIGIVDNMPTRISKIHDRYVLSLFQNEKCLPAKEIPEILLIKRCSEDVVLVINELSWIVLMCKNSTKHIVVKNVIDQGDYIKYFNDFSCE